MIEINSKEGIILSITKVFFSASFANVLFKKSQ